MRKRCNFSWPNKKERCDFSLPHMRLSASPTHSHAPILPIPPHRFSTQTSHIRIEKQTVIIYV